MFVLYACFKLVRPTRWSTVITSQYNTVVSYKNSTDLLDTVRLRTAPLFQQAKIMDANPREADEPMAKYLARVSSKVDSQVQADRAEAERKQVDTLVRKVREMAGGMLDEVIERLLAPAETPADPAAEALEPKAAVAASKEATKH